MAPSEFAAVPCAAGRLVVTASTVIVMPTRAGEHLPVVHWAFQRSSLVSVNWEDNGQSARLTFTLESGEVWSADGVASADAQKVARLLVANGVRGQGNTVAAPSLPQHRRSAQKPGWRLQQLLQLHRTVLAAYERLRRRVPGRHLQP